MLRITTIVIAIALTTLGAGSAFGQALQYLGPSNEAGAPGTGILGFNALCQATYGDGAQFCTSEQILKSGSLPSGQTPLMWVIPTIVSSEVDPTYGVVVFDASGVADPMTVGGGIFSALSCGGWQVMGGGVHGLAMRTAGNFQRAACDTDRPAACCKVTSGQKAGR